MICDTANQFQTVTLIAVLNLLILLNVEASARKGFLYPDVTKFQIELKSCEKY